MFKKKEKTSTITVSGIDIEVRRKRVRNLNIRVYPAQQKVKISAPHSIRSSVIRKFAELRAPWIQKHLSDFRKSPPKPVPMFKSGELHYVWGRPFTLKITEHKKPPRVKMEGEELHLIMREGSNRQKRASVLKEWYRTELKKEIPKLIEKWEKPMGVSVAEFGVKQMKTRWGTCNIRDRRIWLNLELAKRPPECLQYVVVHEMVHLLERLHNKRFYSFMDRFLPDWREKEELLKTQNLKWC